VHRNKSGTVHHAHQVSSLMRGLNSTRHIFFSLVKGLTIFGRDLLPYSPANTAQYVTYWGTTTVTVCVVRPSVRPPVYVSHDACDKPKRDRVMPIIKRQ